MKDKTNDGKPSPGEKKQNEEKIDNVRARQRWFLASRVDADGKLPRAAYAKAVREKRRLQEKQARKGHILRLPADPGLGAVNWTPLGPSIVADIPPHGPGSGRITSLAVGPGASRVYAGAANGGVWRSLDSGENWAPLDDYAESAAPRPQADSLAIGALTVRFGSDPKGANDRIFVGTGEPWDNIDAYFGVGIRVSDAGGAPGSWRLEATNLAGFGVYRITIDPDDPNLVFAATTGGLFRRPSSGVTDEWVRIEPPAPVWAASGPVVSDLVIAGRGASKVYYAALHSRWVCRSANPGDPQSWTRIGGFPSASTDPNVSIGRISLAVSEGDPGVVYVLGARILATGELGRLDGGVFRLISGGPALFRSCPGTYTCVIGVDPSNPDTLYLGGDAAPSGPGQQNHLALYKGMVVESPTGPNFPAGPFDSGFTASTWIGRGVHPDIHALAFPTNTDGSRDGNDVWLATDGGIFRSTRAGANGTFASKNRGLAITQTTYFAQRADTDAVIFAGSQDQGILRYWGEAAWYDAQIGDAGGVAIDPNNPYRLMCQHINTSLLRCADGGRRGTASWSRVSFPPSADSSERTQAFGRFYFPIAVSPGAGRQALVAFSTYRVWVTENWGDSWYTVPTGTDPYASSTPLPEQDRLTGSWLTAVCFASDTRIFAATSTQEIFRFDRNGGWTMSSIPRDGLPPGFDVTRLAVDRATAGSFYITLAGRFRDHVWYYDGAAWHATGFTTPDVVASAVAIDPANPDILYVGTDVGCWKGVKGDSGSGPTWQWSVFSQGLPECAVFDLAIHARARLLRAATYGRGMWEISIDGVAGRDPDIYLRASYSDTGRLGAPNGQRFAWADGVPDPTAPGSNTRHWASPDIKIRRDSIGNLPGLNNPPDYLDFAANVGDEVDAGFFETINGPRGKNLVLVQVHNRGLKPVPKNEIRVLLLLTDAAAGVSALPAGYAARISAGDVSNWLAGSKWFFADPRNPYRSLPGDLDVRVPQVVEYAVDLAATGINFTGDPRVVCAAAFITTTTPVDRLVATETNLDVLTMQDKHVAYRKLHVILPPAIAMQPRLVQPRTTTPQAQSFEIFPGTNVIIDVTATGASPLTYDWKRDGALVQSSTSSRCFIPSFGPLHAGTYTVAVKNAAGQENSMPLRLLLGRPPSP